MVNFGKQMSRSNIIPIPSKILTQSDCEHTPHTMAPISKNKRKTPEAGSSAAPSKRQKVAAKSSASSKKKRVFSVNALAWKKVDIPEMFDDAEGFYGLEAIEGVDVVKNGDQIEFHAVEDVIKAGDDEDEDEFEGFSDAEPSHTTDQKPSEKPLHKSSNKASTTVNNLKEATDIAAELNLGEKTEEVGEKEVEPKAQKGQDAKSKKEKKKEKKEQKKMLGPVAEDPALSSNVFSALGDAPQPAEDDLDMSAWVALDLSPDMVSALARLKFSKPSAIQAAAIPEIIAGHDVIGKAATGSGKTLAFGIPIVEKWLESNNTEQAQEPEQEQGDSSSDKVPLALIISPTRELAHQIMNHIKELCAGLQAQPYVCAVTGGLSVYKQQRQLAKADIVVGTPGRLWEVLSSSNSLMASFKQIQYLAVDEADRLLSDGHFKEAEEILKALDRHTVDEDGEEEKKLSPRQTLVFSATFNKGLQQKLAGKGKNNLLSDEESMEYLLKRLNFREENPNFIDVNPVSQMAEGLKEGMVECGALEKDLYLYALLLLSPNRRSLVFTNSISTARRLTPMLQNLKLNVLPLHSQMAQKARLRSVEKFAAAKPGTSSILIATDVAARGLDIPGIDQVIHYHVPRTADMYVHRSGRTARAQCSGLSIILCAPEEVTPMRRLAAKVHHEQAVRKKYVIRTIDVDRRVAQRLKPRVELAKRITDAVLAKEKGGKDDDWVRKAAEDLGVEYDSEELEKSGSWGGRGSQKKKKQKEAMQIGKAELGAMRAQLRDLLSRRVNTGVSERYITDGRVDVDELLKGVTGDFLGRVDALDVDF
ncbi:DEAD-domain-containing protein [Sodiomyces alkalinus F11]|uniref:ATP-dependent RNA helicase n=1 Tax=Sodiomyces alkalinus (strain CBS 110278 / VKM F-3762 / F11) TaxID=1314773 RepID=A0A3N2PPN9_SODAK|nr:DEAD-domain-containing protein [Sodiomyces alkalinus F11]ROT36473.1 DEAD-domain-containing protein [Sodiomyces alkalinus F11]